MTDPTSDRMDQAEQFAQDLRAGNTPCDPRLPARLANALERLHRAFDLGARADDTDKDCCDEATSNRQTEPTVTWTSPEEQHLGRFTLGRILGQGTFGIVYLAHDTLLHRDVALKVPRAEVLISPELRERFVREGKATADLHHSNIVQVFEARAEGMQVYLASEYCAGSTLADWLRDRPEPTLTPRSAARIVAELADGLEHAHRRGILHRDLKPSNILLEPITDSTDSFPWATKICDFGLARFMNEARDRTRTGIPLGTVRYMSPEQAAGRHAQLTPATDVYSLGVILHELLTGTLPFDGESEIDVIRDVASTDPPRPLRSKWKGIPRDMESICLKALAKSSTRRYETAAALADDLRRFVRCEPVLARPVSRLEHVVRWCWRHPTVTSAISIAVLAIASIVVLSLRHAMMLRG